MTSITSKASEVLLALQEARNTNTNVRRGLTMPLTAGKCETHTTKLKEDTEYHNSFLQNRLFSKLMKNTAAQDETSQINELANKILDYGKAATIGRSMCSVHYTDKETLKIRKPKEGKAKKTAGDTWSINTKGQRNEYVEVKTDKYLDSGDEWTTAQVEDTEYDYLMAQTQESMYNLAKLESQVILDKFTSLEDDSGIAGTVAKADDHEDINMDTLIALRGKLSEKDRQVRAYVMSEATLTQLLQDEKLQNSEYLTSGSFDYDTGMINATFLGAKFLPSSLMAADKCYAIDTDVTMLYVLRRDALIEPYTRTDAGVHGLRITSRYGLEVGRKDGLAVWKA